MGKKKYKSTSIGEDLIFAGSHPLIPEGEYEAMADRIDKAVYHQKKKLYVWFKIISENYQGTTIFMSFNIPDDIRPSSKYYQEWVKANDGVQPLRNSRISPNVFKHKIFLIKVRTVLSDSKQAKLGENTYSVVDKILQVAAGAPIEKKTTKNLSTF